MITKKEKNKILEKLFFGNLVVGEILHNFFDTFPSYKGNMPVNIMQSLLLEENNSNFPDDQFWKDLGSFIELKSFI